MIDFNWKLQEVPSRIRKGLLEKHGLLLRPHADIWGDESGGFTELADSIFRQLPSEKVQEQFLSVCLASYLLDPKQAPSSVVGWILAKRAIPEIIGCDVGLDELKKWRWDRAAFPVMDEYGNGRNDTIYYALVSSSKAGILTLFPSWIAKVMNADAQESVSIAAKLVCKSHPDSSFFFWPFINPNKPTHDRSLGLPVYLSFLSLAINKHIPMIIATGEVDHEGRLYPVHGVFDKCAKAFQKNYKKFIYPVDGSSLEKRKEQKPVDVANLIEAECQWGVRKKATVIDDKDKASLVRHVQTICSAVLGSDNLPYILISAFDTNNEEIPPNIIATHEYMIVVDIKKARCVKPQLRDAFTSFIGKDIFHYKTDTLDWLYWGEGERLFHNH